MLLGQPFGNSQRGLLGGRYRSPGARLLHGEDGELVTADLPARPQPGGSHWQGYTWVFIAMVPAATWSPGPFQHQRWVPAAVVGEVGFAFCRQRSTWLCPQPWRVAAGPKRLQGSK